MSTPFKPANGHTSQWKLLYKLVSSLNVDDEITYEKAMQVLDTTDRSKVQHAMRDAIHHLEADKVQSVRTVPNFGYVVMKAAEHLDATDHHMQKSRTQAKVAYRKVSAIDSRRGELTQAERAQADLQKTTAGLLIDIIARKSISVADKFKKALGSL